MSIKRISGILLIVLILIVIIFNTLPSSVARYNPSSTPAYLPNSADSFETYVGENRRRIRAALEEYYFDNDPSPFGPAYTLDDVVEMRSPYQLLPNAADCENGGADSRGFLLAHGLTDSPYLLRSVADSLAEIFPCAIFRGLLNPGHGTIPGDLLQASFEDWYGNFEYGVKSFSSEVDQLYVVGYSIGSALALTYLDNNRDSEEIEGLVLLSPGLESTTKLAFLAPYFRNIYKWLARQGDTDAAKYESLPSNAAAEFFALSQSVTYGGFMPLEIRALVVASEDDTTVNVQTSLGFFCQNLNHSDNKFILYRSSHNEVSPNPLCDRIEIQENTSNDSRYVSHSHVAVSIPPLDPHYGIDGNYPVCLAHVDYPERLQNCLSNDRDSAYAENTYVDDNGLFEGKIVRRTSFNSRYAEMIAQIECFIRETCQSEN